jgi:hypothetical protein
MYIHIHVMYPLFLSDFNKTWIFSTYFAKNTQTSSLMKIHPEWAELLHADGHTDGRKNMTKLRVVFRNFSNAPNNGFIHIYIYTYVRSVAYLIALSVVTWLKHLTNDPPLWVTRCSLLCFVRKAQIYENKQNKCTVNLCVCNYTKGAFNVNRI